MFLTYGRLGLIQGVIFSRAKNTLNHIEALGKEMFKHNTFGVDRKVFLNINWALLAKIMQFKQKFILKI